MEIETVVSCISFVFESVLSIPHSPFAMPYPRGISLLRKSVRDFFRTKGFYGFFMDFPCKQKDFCQRRTRFFWSEMPLGHIIIPPFHHQAPQDKTQMGHVARTNTTRCHYQMMIVTSLRYCRCCQTSQTFLHWSFACFVL